MLQKDVHKSKTHKDEVVTSGKRATTSEALSIIRSRNLGGQSRSIGNPHPYGEIISRCSCCSSLEATNTRHFDPDLKSSTFASDCGNAEEVPPKSKYRYYLWLVFATFVEEFRQRLALIINDCFVWVGSRIVASESKHWEAELNEKRQSLS